MDTELIFFLILAAISLISNILNNRKKAQKKRDAERRRQEASQAQPSTEEEESPRRKPFSFEDLFEEFEATHSERNRPEEVEDRDYPSEQVEDVETVEEPEIVEEHGEEKEKSAYESYEGTSFEKLDSDAWKDKKMGIKEKPLTDRLTTYSKKENKYAKLLSTKSGLKQGIILSEILKRKY